MLVPSHLLDILGRNLVAMRQAAIGPEAEPDHDGATPPMLIEAHRGYSCLNPENTLVAFKAAMDAGIRWIELDVHETRDGDFVVMHDVSVTGPPMVQER